MANWYMKGQSEYVAANFHMGFYIDHSGFSEGDYDTRNMESHGETSDPFMAFGIDTGPATWTYGQQQVEIGLLKSHRLKFDTTGCYKWAGPGQDDWTLLGAGGGGNLGDLDDVTIDGTPADNELLAWDTSSSKWINQTPAEAGLATTGDLHSETHALATTGPHTGSLPLTDIASYVQGSIIKGGAGDWEALGLGTQNYVLKAGANEPAWGQVAWGEVTGKPTEFTPTAHILGTTGPHTGTLPWGDLSKTGSSLADLVTRAHSNLSDAPTSAHHVRYADSEAVLSIVEKWYSLTEHGTGRRSLRTPYTNNCLFSSDKRFTIIKTGTTITYSPAGLFNGDLMDYPMTIADGNVVTLNIDLIDKSEWTGNGLTYSYGNVYIHDYATYKASSVRARLFTRNGGASHIWRDWENGVNISTNSSYAIWEISLTGNWNCQEIEIEITASGNDVWVSEIEWNLNRNLDHRSFPVIAKYLNSNTYGSLTFKDSSNVSKTTISSTGIAMTTNKITGLGNGTSAQDAMAFGQKYTLEQHNNTYHSTNYHSEADGTGVVTVHSDITNAGSGIIITAGERNALHPEQHAMDNATYHTRTDITTLNASTGFHGFLKKLDNIATNFMNGQGNWAVPAGSYSLEQHDNAYHSTNYAAETRVFEQSTTFPGSPSEGDLHYDEDDDSWYRYNADSNHPSWVEVGAGGGVASEIDNLGNHTATQALAMATFKITGMGDPTADQDAATKKYVLDNVMENFGVASDDEVFSNDSVKSNSTSTPTKVKEIICYKGLKCRIYHEMRSSIGGTSHGKSRVYINGSAVGSINDNATTSWIAYTEDIEVEVGDKIQIYAWEEFGAGAGEVRYMKIKFIEYVSNDP